MTAKRELAVEVLRARLESPATVCAKVQLGDQPTGATRYSDRTATPAWNQTFRFPVNDPSIEKLRVVLLSSRRLLPDREVGWIEVDPSCLPRDTAKVLSMPLIVRSWTSDVEAVELKLTAVGFGEPPGLLRSAVGQLSWAPSVAFMVSVLEALRPLAMGALEALRMVSPFVEVAFSASYDLWLNYNLESYAPVMLGLVMIFFGGTYMTTFAAVEAYRLTGWDRTKAALISLFENLSRAAAAIAEERQRDPRRPPPDARLKWEIALKNIDPEAFSEALVGLHVGTLAVAATLRARFARAVALGASIGEVLHSTFGPILVPA
eukprot:RCo049046